MHLFSRQLIHLKDHRIYEELVHSEAVTVVVLVNSHKRNRMRAVIRNFEKAVGRLNHRAYYLCYKTHEWWFGEMLKECSTMYREEAKARLSACYNGGAVTVLALFGARKQLCIFPESVVVCNGIRTTIEERKIAMNEAAVMQQPAGNVLEDTLGFADASPQAVNGGGLEHDHSHQRSVEPDNNSSGDEEAAAGCDGSNSSGALKGGPAAPLGSSNDRETEQNTERVQGGTRPDLEAWLERLVEPNGPVRYEVQMWPQWQS